MTEVDQVLRRPPPAAHFGGQDGRKAALAVLLLAGSVVTAPAFAQEKRRLAFVVNAASDFWKLAEAGVAKARADLPELELQVKYPAQGTAALQAAGKLGAMTVVAFDEDPVTLGAVKESSFASTEVQQPFEWGYQGMKLMAGYLDGDMSGVPADGLNIVPTVVINKDNLNAFEADL